MTMPSRNRCLALFVVAVLAIGWGSGTEPILPKVFQMAFRETSAKQYILCPQAGDMYCMASYPSTRTFSGTLTLFVDSVMLSGDGSWAGRVSTDSTGAEQIKFVRPSVGIPSGCGGMALIVATTADTIAGSWSEQFDCHGLSGGGTFVGHRQ